MAYVAWPHGKAKLKVKLAMEIERFGQALRGILK